ncbi:MAG: hypothetical protein AB7S97_02025 [Thermoplasmata archaeon]
MRALADLETAMVDAGMPAEEAEEIVDGFETAVQECLDELEDEETDDDGTEETERAGDGSPRI